MPNVGLSAHTRLSEFEASQYLFNFLKATVYTSVIAKFSTLVCYLYLRLKREEIQIFYHIFYVFALCSTNHNLLHTYMYVFFFFTLNSSHFYKESEKNT